MFYIPKDSTTGANSATELDRLAGEYVPSTWENFSTSFTYGQNLPGQHLSDINVGYVARQTGSDDYFIERKLTGDPIFEQMGLATAPEEGENRPLSREEYEASSLYREELPYIDGLTTWAQQSRTARFDQQRVREDIMSRDDSWWGAATSFTGILAGSIVDAKNVATGVAVGAAASAATPIVGGLAGTATTVGRGVRNATKAWSALKNTRPVTAGLLSTTAMGTATAVPQITTGLRAGEITGEQYDMTDAAVDLMAGIAIDSLLKAGVAGGRAIRNRYFNRNVTDAELASITEVAHAQLAAGEPVDIEPLIDAVVMRDPPKYSTVAFQSEAPVIKKGDDGNYEAVFESESGLMQGTKGVGKSPSSAEKDLRTKYMAEEIPQDVIRDIGPTAARQSRDVAIARAELAETSFALSAKQALDADPRATSSEELQGVKQDYDSSLQRVAETKEQLRLRPNSNKRKMAHNNAQVEMQRQARRFEQAVRQQDPNLTSRIDSQRAERQAQLDREEARIRESLQQQSAERLKAYAERQLNPEAAQSIDSFRNTYTFGRMIEDAQKLRETVNNPEALEAKRIEARQDLDARLEDPRVPEDYKEVIRSALKDVDEKRSVNDSLYAWAYRLQYEGRTDAEDIFPSNSKNRKLYEEILEGVKLRQELNSIKNDAEHLQEILDMLIYDQSEEIAIREVALRNTIDARADLNRNMRGFIEAGETHSMALIRTLERASNTVAHERVQAHNSFSVALDAAGVDKYFSKLSRSKDKTASINILREIENVENGGKKPVTSSPEAFKVAEIFKTIHDSYRYRGFQTGLRTRNLKRHFLEQYWNPNQLRESGDAAAFVNDMAPRIDVEATFGAPVSDGTVRNFLKDFYEARVNGQEDLIRVEERDLFSQRKTDYRRMFDNREIILRSEEDTLHVIDQYGGGSVTWGMINALTQSATRSSMSEVYGVNPMNMKDFLIEQLFRDAPQSEKNKVMNPGVLAVVRGNIDDIISAAGVDVEYNLGNMSLVKISSTLRNLTRGVLLEAVLISSIPDVAVRRRAATRVMQSGLSRDIRRNFRQSMRNIPDEIREQASRAISTASAYSIGEQMAMFAGHGTSAKLANMSVNFANFVFKYGGMNAWTSHNKKAAYVFANTFYANTLSLPFENMNVHSKGALLRAGITAQDWKALKKFVVPDPTTNSRFFHTEEIARVDPKLASKVNTLLLEFADEAVITPGVREKAILGQTKKITGTGSFLHSFAGTLLGYPVTFMTKAVGRELAAGGMKGLAGLGILAASTTVAGGISQIASEVSKGRMPDPTDSPGAALDFVASAFGRGAGGAFVSTLILNSLTYGDTATKTAAGVVPQLVDDLLDVVLTPIKAPFTDDTLEESAAKMLRGARTFIPVDFPIIGGLFDNFVYYPLLEHLDPDMVKRMEDRYEDRTGGELRAFVK